MLDNLLRKLIMLPGLAKQIGLAMVDAILLISSAWSAIFVRTGVSFFSTAEEWLFLLTAPLTAIPVFIRMGLYRAVLRYLGEHVLWAIIKAMAIATGLWLALVTLIGFSHDEIVPKSVWLLYWMFGVMFVAGIRFIARWIVWLPIQRQFHGQQALIYGAGEAGRQIAAALREGRDIYPVGFLDDDPNLQGKDVNGLRVYSPTQMENLVRHYAIREVIVALPSVPSARRREIVQFLDQYPIRVRILPEVTEMTPGRHLLKRIREVDIGDLLGRDAISPDQKLLRGSVTGRNVLVTGAGGSIGTELCRQITALNPRKLVLLDHSEFALYQVERALRTVAQCELVARLGTILDSSAMSALMAEQAIQTVYHAAAYKHVPIVEANPLEGVRNNVLGTLAVAHAAFEVGVATFVLISTDKAVRPSNVMGASKRWAELIVQALAEEARREGRAQRFCAVRFGNVLGSSGSVIPLFREQIAQGGPVTVTHPEVSRYFMSIHEAVQLVIQAGSIAEGGEVFLLDMGAPVKIVDLAANMIRLSGHTVKMPGQSEGDIEIVFTGLRPGEKLHEELQISHANAEGTIHPKIMKVIEPSESWSKLEKDLERLSNLIQVGNVESVRSLLMQRACGESESLTENKDLATNSSPRIVPLPLDRARRG